MNDLIDKLVADAGLTADQANKTLEVIKAFVKEKFPMLGGAVDNVFTTPGPSSAAANTAGGWMDKISDLIPGDLGEKIEGYAKKAADSAEDAFESAKDTAEDLLEKGKQKLDDWEKKV